MNTKEKQKILMDNYLNPDRLDNFLNSNDFLMLETPKISCADSYNLYYKKENEIITNIFFNGEGCIISKASINLMLNLIINKKISEINPILDQYLDLIEKGTESKSLGDLNAFHNTKNTPARVDCALLVYNSLKGIS